MDRLEAAMAVNGKVHKFFETRAMDAIEPGGLLSFGEPSFLAKAPEDYVVHQLPRATILGQ